MKDKLKEILGDIKTVKMKKINTHAWKIDCTGTVGGILGSVAIPGGGGRSLREQFMDAPSSSSSSSVTTDGWVLLTSETCEELETESGGG